MPEIVTPIKNLVTEHSELKLFLYFMFTHNNVDFTSRLIYC
jgi:hypothetical protein